MSCLYTIYTHIWLELRLARHKLYRHAQTRLRAAKKNAYQAMAHADHSRMLNRDPCQGRTAVSQPLARGAQEQAW